MAAIESEAAVAAALASARQLRCLPALRPFAPVSLDFVDAFSRMLRAMPALRAHPELAALGFWMRRANITRICHHFQASASGQLFQPRGIAFHIAPSNVDSMFVYSWFLSIICGNKNIVRLPSRSSPGMALLTRVFDELLAMEEWRKIAERALLVRYDRDDRAATAGFSSLCDLRVIWGGDATVAGIRQVPLAPRACEVAFANKFSMAIIRADGWNRADLQRQQEWLVRFFNDTYTFGQMACSSPRLLAWHGHASAVAVAQENFWNGLSALVRTRSTRLQPIDYVNKRTAADLIALRLPASIRDDGQNDICRIALPIEAMRKLIDTDLHCGAGLFYETSIDSLDSLDSLLDRRIQTVTYAGYGDGAELREHVATRILAGIDRIVPFGCALDFAPVWDGFDLFRLFMRQVTVS
jgi:hypothetical protein